MGFSFGAFGLKRNVVIVIALSMALIFGCFSQVPKVAALQRGYISFEFDDGFQTQFDYAFPILQAHNAVATFMVATGYINGAFPSWQGGAQCMTSSELLVLQNAGMEIGSHGVTHNSLVQYGNVEFELANSQASLRGWGLTGDNFAYPNGERNDYTDSVAMQYYHSATGGYEGYYRVDLPCTLFHLPICQGDFGNANDLPTIKAMVDDAYNTNSWELIALHNVLPNGGAASNTMSSATFEAFLDYIQSKGVTIVTVEQGLHLSNVTPTPMPTLTPNPSSIYGTPTDGPISTTVILAVGFSALLGLPIGAFVLKMKSPSKHRKHGKKRS